MLTVAFRRCYATILIPGLLAAAACGSATDPAGSRVAAVAGTYALKTVAGKALPAAVAFSVDVGTTASHATRTLNADGTCSESGTYTSQAFPRPPVTFSGTAMTCTWTLSGQTVTFTTESAQNWYRATTTATIAADGTLTEQPTSPTSVGYIYPRTYGR